MFDIPLTLALTILGGIATISLTIYKIVGNRKADSECIAKIYTINAVQDEKIRELEKDINKLEKALQKLNDLILDLLTKDN